jgi:hypothetical protein
MSREIFVWRRRDPPESSHFVGLIATSNAAHKTAINEIVQHGDFFRQAQGLPDRQNHRGSTDLETLGTLPNVQRLHKWRWRVPVIGEMVLGNEAIVETECLRVLDLLHSFFKEQLPIAQRRVRPLVKQPKLHGAFPSCSARRLLASLTLLPC